MGQCSTNEKFTKDPVQWLTTKLGPRKAKQKLAEIEAYFKAAALFAASHQGDIRCTDERSS